MQNLVHSLFAFIELIHRQKNQTILYASANFLGTNTILALELISNLLPV